MRLAEKVAIITGGGSGFGEVTARLFASEGAAVMLADINGPAAAAVAESINNEGGRASWAKTDVSSASSVEAMVQVTMGNFERVIFSLTTRALNPSVRSSSPMKQPGIAHSPYMYEALSCVRSTLFRL